METRFKPTEKRVNRLIELQVGDRVRRIMGGVPMDLLITEINAHHIYCGPWKFDRKTGAEIDEELGWDNSGTGSFIVPIPEKET